VRRRILIGVAVAIAAVAGAVVFVVLRGNGSLVGRSRAVARHVALQGSDPATGLPAPGVYTYATSGSECAGVGSLCLHRSLPHRAVVVVARRGRYLTVETDLRPSTWRRSGSGSPRTGGCSPGSARGSPSSASPRTTRTRQTLGLDLRFSISRRIGGTFPYRLEVSARLLGVAPLR
jgi:hypothetical protein